MGAKFVKVSEVLGKLINDVVEEGKWVLAEVEELPAGVELGVEFELEVRLSIWSVYFIFYWSNGFWFFKNINSYCKPIRIMILAKRYSLEIINNDWGIKRIGKKFLLQNLVLQK